jgi:hypothetical protein
LAELAASARALGGARVHCLDYEDSGSTGEIEAHRLPFARAVRGRRGRRAAAGAVDEQYGHAGQLAAGQRTRDRGGDVELLTVPAAAGQPGRAPAAVRSAGTGGSPRPG